MEQGIIFESLGLRSYNEVLKLQEAVFNHLVNEKKSAGLSASPMRLIFCEHEPVFTLGKNGDENNLLQSLSSRKAEFVRTNRGGDITFHGPGQIVGYPILDLERLNIGLAKYIELLEETVIQVIAKYGLIGERLSTASGVWLDVGVAGKERKICALGIKSSRWVTMHGFAFNVNTDLTWFESINPCGFQDKGVTSLEKELGKALNKEAVQIELKDQFLKLFKLKEIVPKPSTHVN